ncbi:RNA polymerase subunit sigma-70 [Taibaiella sp. KBW10]|uniref:RNA polymerase sigma factor n=1 Tax=Taibaiella sp. KBW10 TaxID=2153357 RepID=UPI000F5AC115|nr:RNA polymerase sigma factor [Taibaiella sp. KBW10]RQO32622.1 RNA polymerase subunit sigma-70 [Taibaiella sp. KBW10]
MQHPYATEEYTIYQESKQGKPAAQQWLYAEYYPMAAAVCLRYIASVPDAEEVVADSFIRFFKALSTSFQYQGAGSMKAYLKKITVNQSLMFLRKQRFSFEEMGEQHEQLADVNLDALGQLSAKDILKAVQQLPTGYRTVFNMYVMEGYSHAEIGEALLVSVATSKTQLMKAKLQLQKILSVYERYL